MQKSNNKKAGVAIIISDKNDFKTNKKNLTRDKVGHFIMKRGSIYQEEVPIVNIYTPSSRVPKNTELKLTEKKEEAS